MLGILINIDQETETTTTTEFGPYFKGTNTLDFYLNFLQNPSRILDYK